MLPSFSAMMPAENGWFVLYSTGLAYWNEYWKGSTRLDETQTALLTDLFRRRPELFQFDNARKENHVVVQ